jgi:predicted RNA binding protein YcfA (HicA-like mRNA interferase family)
MLRKPYYQPQGPAHTHIFTHEFNVLDKQCIHNLRKLLQFIWHEAENAAAMATALRCNARNKGSHKFMSKTSRNIWPICNDILKLPLILAILDTSWASETHLSSQPQWKSWLMHEKIHDTRVTVNLHTKNNITYSTLFYVLYATWQSAWWCGTMPMASIGTVCLVPKYVAGKMSVWLVDQDKTDWPLNWRSVLKWWKWTNMLLVPFS